MTEHDETREERAFRAALERQADAYAPAPLRTDGGGRYRTWTVVAGVAAALVLVIGGTTWLVKANPPAADEASNAIDVASPTLSTQVTASCVNDACLGTSLPAPADGWKWVSWRNVAVQVPRDWGYGFEPEGMGCGRTAPPDPATPYVTLDRTYDVNGQVACGIQGDPAIPSQMQALNGDTTDPAYWRAHLTFSEDGDAGTPGRIQYGGWTLATTGVAGSNVTISLLDRDDDSATMERIDDSATTFTTDQNGCPASSPLQTQKHVRPHSPDWNTISVSICQYDRNVPSSQPGLMASRLLEGGAASALVSAIDSAPAGGGPDSPSQCLNPLAGDTAIELIVHGDTVTLDGDGDATAVTQLSDMSRHFYVYYDGCDGNGIDDGTTIHRLTQADCLPLFAELPIQLLSGLQPVFEACAPDFSE